MRIKRSSIVARGAFAVAAAVTMLLAATHGNFSPADAALAAEQRDGAPERFLSGSERSLAVLQAMQTTLEQIDARLQRIEKLMAERQINQQTAPSSPAVPIQGGPPW
jgi:hypothetical protein